MVSSMRGRGLPGRRFSMFAARDDFLVFCEVERRLFARDVPCLPARRDRVFGVPSGARHR